ncbi:hypothetical protein L208DRAFT_1203856, partial [Tricholoma matsutake]
AHWNPQETQVLLDYLVTHKSEGKGAGSFKDPTFNAAVSSIAPLLTLGPPKTLKSCKNKWASLKATFKMIESYQNVSGAHWDPQRGANIQGEAASNLGMKAFCNNGWEYFEKCQEIMFLSTVRGSHIYHPTTAMPPTFQNETD